MSDLIAKTAIEQKINVIVRPVIEALGYQLVRIRLSSGRNATLQIMIDKAGAVFDNSININDCTRVSTNISIILDVKEPLAKNYRLEISSPGIERPLTRLKDFFLYKGYRAQITAAVAVCGQQNFNGILCGVRDSQILLETIHHGKQKVFALKFNTLVNAYLVCDHNLLKQSAPRQKHSNIDNKMTAKT